MYKPRRQKGGGELSKRPCLSTRGRGVKGLSLLTKNISVSVTINTAFTYACGSNVIDVKNNHREFLKNAKLNF